MARFAVLKQSLGIKKCAFCKYYYDPSYTVISPKKGQKNVWEYENNRSSFVMLRDKAYIKVKENYTIEAFLGKVFSV